MKVTTRVNYHQEIIDRLDVLSNAAGIDIEILEKWCGQKGCDYSIYPVLSFHYAVDNRSRVVPVDHIGDRSALMRLDVNWVLGTKVGNGKSGGFSGLVDADYEKGVGVGYSNLGANDSAIIYVRVSKGFEGWFTNGPISSKPIFPELRERDLAKADQATRLLFDVYDKIMKKVADRDVDEEL